MPQHAHARSQTLTFAAARMPIILPRCVYGPQLAEDVKDTPTVSTVDYKYGSLSLHWKLSPT